MAMDIVGLEAKNIFSALFNGCALQSRKEDYLTAGLFSTLQFVLESGNKELGIETLNSLLSGRPDFPFTNRAKINMQPQKIHRKSKVRRSKPDITVESKDELENRLIFIEDKVRPLNYEDIKRLKKYRERLNTERKKGKWTLLVLITPSGKEDDEGSADRQISWLNVANEFQKLYCSMNRQEIEGIVLAYLAKSFKDFIEEKVMYVGKLEDEINKSEMYKLITLLRIIGNACEDAGLKRLQLASNLDRVQPDSWTGYWTDGKKYAVGVYVEDPRKVYFEIHQGDEIRKKFKNEEQVHKLFHPDAELWEWEKNTILSVPIILSDDFFASTQGKEQADIISKFIAEIRGKWEKSSTNNPRS